MGSLRFPFGVPQPPKHPHGSHGSSSPSSISTPAGVVCSVAAAVGVGIGLSVATTHNAKNQRKFLLQSDLINSIHSNLGPHGSSPLWGSLCLAYTSSVLTDPRTHTSFPSILNHTQRLLGIGLRQKDSPWYCWFKTVDYYAFGVYADETDIKKLLTENYGKLSGKEILKALLEKDIGMTVRLQIVSEKFSIHSVRDIFHESIGDRLRKFGRSDNQRLLKSFTSQFEDDRKVAKGSVIDLSRDKGQVLRTEIDGKEVGSIKSELLCRSILDLYIGEDPFDKAAKEEIKQKLASIVKSTSN